MEIIAKTKEGVLINATEQEVEAIVSAVTGEKPKEINIGLKLPAIDYASTITKVKALANDRYFKRVIEYANNFRISLNELVKVIDQAKEIDV